MPDEVLRSERLDLPLLSVAAMQALLDDDLATAGREIGVSLPTGWMTENLRGLIRLRLGQVATDPDAHRWLVRAVMLRDPAPTLVGNAGFHGPPDATGTVEVGYEVLPAHRRRGYAEETVRTLFAWAARQPGVTRLRASVGPWNAPSLALVRKLGMVQVGTQLDPDDGLELVFERPAGDDGRRVGDRAP
jgi:ribosomal-protein-alanine N-acetyltransferase